MEILRRTERKKATMFFGHHDEAAIPHLEAFSDAIESTLSTTKGKVGIVVEDFHRTRINSEIVTQLVNDGFKPSDALVSTFLSVRKLHGYYPNSSEVQAWRAEKPDTGIADPFTRSQYEVLDNLFADEDRANRLLLIPERNRQTTLLADDIAGAHKNIDKLVKKFLEEKVLSEFDYRRELYRIRGQSAIRDTDLSDLTSLVLAEPEVGGIVTYMGAGHSEVGDLFVRRDDVEVKRVFTEKENGVYVFDPIDAIIKRRHLAHNPASFMTLDEARIGQARTIIWKMVSQSAKRSGRMTEQTVRRHVWAATKDMTTQDVDDFVGVVQENGIQAGIKDVFDKDKQEHRAQREEGAALPTGEIAEPSLSGVLYQSIADHEEQYKDSKDDSHNKQRYKSK